MCFQNIDLWYLNFNIILHTKCVIKRSGLYTVHMIIFYVMGFVPLSNHLLDAENFYTNSHFRTSLLIVSSLSTCIVFFH